MDLNSFTSEAFASEVAPDTWLIDLRVEAAARTKTLFRDASGLPLHALKNHHIVDRDRFDQAACVQITDGTTVVTLKSRAR